MDAEKQRFLIVSDDPEARRLIRQATDDAGYQASEVTTGQAGLDLADGETRFSIAIVDLRLSDPPGTEVCRRLSGTRGRHGRLPVIGLVPSDRRDLIEEAVSRGVDDFLCLPLIPELVRARLDTQMSGVLLNETLIEQTRDLELILELSRSLAATVNVDGILFELVSKVAGTLGIDRCSLVLSDEGWRRGLVLASSDNAEIEDLEVDLSDYPEIQQVLSTSRPLVIQHAAGHPLLAAVKDKLSSQNVGSLAVFPLQHEQEPMGVLFMRASPQRGPFSERTIRSARTIAHTTAIALRNAQMFERIRRESAQASAEKAVVEKEVADLKQTQAELRSTKDFLENLVNSSANAIIASDMRGRVLVWNKAAERVLGYERQDALENLNVADVYYDDAREVMAALRSEGGGGIGRLEEHPVHILSKEGERIPVTLSATLLYEDGREIASVGILTDMRARLLIEEKLSRAQDRLMRTEKQVMIAELAGTTAHELNQPLTSVMGYAELLKRRIPPTDPNYRAIDIVFRESERMAEIVRKIGRITRYETKDYLGKTRIVDLDRSTDRDD